MTIFSKTETYALITVALPSKAIWELPFRLSNSLAHSTIALLLTFQPVGQLSITRLIVYSSNSQFLVG